MNKKKKKKQQTKEISQNQTDMQSSSDYLHTLAHVMSRKHQKNCNHFQSKRIENERDREKDETEKNECVDCTKITIEHSIWKWYLFVGIICERV